MSVLIRATLRMGNLLGVVPPCAGVPAPFVLVRAVCGSTAGSGPDCWNGTTNCNTIQIRRGGPQMVYNEVWKNQARPRRRLLMPYRIRQIAPESKYCHQLSLGALHRFF